MPTLWTVVQLENEALALLYLKRSDPLLVDLRASWAYAGDAYLSRAILSVRRDCHRWERITVRLANRTIHQCSAHTIISDLDMAIGSAESNSHLRYFSLKSTSQGGENSTFSYEAVNFPRVSSLEHVELVGVALRSFITTPPIHFKDMRQLRIASSHALSAHCNIMPLISEMPVLAKLTIEDVERFGSPGFLGNVPHIFMECLETLELIDVRDDMACCLIKAISAPKLCRLVLHLRTPRHTTIDLWPRAASKYHSLRCLSASGAPRNIFHAMIGWLECLSELQHLDISRLCPGETSGGGAHTALRSLADSDQGVCPSLVRLQVSEDCDPATRKLLKGVVKLRSGRGDSDFTVVVSNGDGYKELIL